MKTLTLGGFKVRAYVDGNGIPKLDQDDVKAWQEAGWKQPSFAEQKALREWFDEQHRKRGK